MLELPEVEVLRKDLEKEVVGKRVKAVIVQTPSILKPFHRTRPEFTKLLEERKIEAVNRRGTAIFIELDEDLTWLILARGSASLHRETATEAPGSDTHLVVSFSTGGAIHLSDTAKEPEASTGVVPKAEALALAEVNPDALDPLEDNPTWMDFGARLDAHPMPLKAFLMDEDLVLGLGEVYSDEVLFEAGLRYDRGSNTLSTQEVRRLYRAMQEVIATAIKMRGTRLDDHAPAEDVDEDGLPAEHLRAYHRDGLPCLRCRRTLVKARAKGMKGRVYTYFCEQCQM